MEVTGEKQAGSSVEKGAPQGAQQAKSTEPGLEAPSAIKRIAAIALTLAMALLAIVLLVRARDDSKNERKSGSGSSEAAATGANFVTIDQSQEQGIKVEPVKLLGFTAEKAATGKIAFNEDFMTPVFSPFTGRIVTLIAKPGDVVRKGSPLFTIDTPDLVQAESDLLTSASAVTKAKAALELAERTEDREHRLYLAKAVALRDWEQAETDVTSAQSDLRSATATETAARDRLKVFGKTDADIAAVEATKKIDRITQVASPITGTIVTRKVGTGQYVKPDNPDPLFTLVNTSTMWMLADVYEADAPLVKEGEQVHVNVMAFPGDTFNARISYISPVVDPNTHRIAVRCVVDNSRGQLKPEMFASFEILTSDPKKSLGVPITSLVRDGDRTTVWVSEGAGRFERRTVTTGLQQNGYAEVVSGLKDGDQIVSDGSLLLSNLAAS